MQDTSFQTFWEKVLSPRLGGRYGVKPVHTLEEISLLAARFPDQIKQFSAYQGEEILAGVTVYETPTVAHAQYSAATEKGRHLGAQTYLANALIEHYQHKQVFDFGISNENGGRVLNQGLQDWKEGFGARCFSHDFYEVATANYSQLEHIIGPMQVVLAQPAAAPEAAAGYEEKQSDLSECPVVAKDAAPSGMRERIRNWICYVTGISVDEMCAQTGSVVMQAACCL